MKDIHDSEKVAPSPVQTAGDPMAPPAPNPFGTITASWDSPTTDVAGALLKLKKQAMLETGLTMVGVDDFMAMHAAPPELLADGGAFDMNASLVDWAGYVDLNGLEAGNAE